MQKKDNQQKVFEEDAVYSREDAAEDWDGIWRSHRRGHMAHRENSRMDIICQLGTYEDPGDIIWCIYVQEEDTEEDWDKILENAPIWYGYRDARMDMICP